MVCVTAVQKTAKERLGGQMVPGARLKEGGYIPCYKTKTSVQRPWLTLNLSKKLSEKAWGQLVSTVIKSRTCVFRRVRFSVDAA